MNEGLKSYIGITDFTNFGQVTQMLEVFQRYKQPISNRILHIGIMMSHKTLHGIPSKWQDVFPQKETIADIFASKETYNCLHYADYDKNPELWKSLVQAICYGGENIHALQLDMIWPDPDEIARAIYRFPRQKIEIILQIGKNAIEEANNDPLEVARRVENYDNIIHRVLLDKSMGRGLGMDANGLIPFAWIIQNRLPDLGIGAAGGLGPDTISLVEALAKEFPDLSIDAQGKLRPSGNALDPIDWVMAATYLIKALELLK